MFALSARFLIVGDLLLNGITTFTSVFRKSIQNISYLLITRGLLCYSTNGRCGCLVATGVGLAVTGVSLDATGVGLDATEVGLIGILEWF